MCTTTESDYLFAKYAYFFLVKFDFLCEGLYTLTKCQILIKKFNFLGYVNMYVLLFIKVFHLSDNCHVDSKYKVIIFLQNMPIFLGKCDLLCKGLYTLTKCQILIKKLQFLRIC